MRPARHRPAQHANPSILGFTLVELLVVVAIIALLLSILLPSLTKARKIAEATVCGSNQSSILLSLRMYADDNRDLIPYGYIPGRPMPSIGEPAGFAEWWNRLGADPDGYTEVDTNGYLPYDPERYSGGTFHCPLADEIEDPWLFSNRFSAHYSMNQYLRSTRRPNGEWITRVASGAITDRPRRMSEVTGQKVFIGDGRIHLFREGYYFLGEFNHNYGPGWNQFEPWAVDVADGSVTGHIGAINLGYVDGHVERATQWGADEMEQEFLVD